MELRDYQKRLASDGVAKLKLRHIVYFCCQVRTGKTLMALETANLYGAKKVLFLTKKKAIESIESDYNAFGFTYDITITNNESLHKVTGDFDLVISDEHHRFGAYPKPNATAKLFKTMFGHLPMIFLSGTPTAESHSQWYHQFWVSNHSPFADYPNFYKWANEYVDIQIRHLGYAQIKDYSKANKEAFWHRIRHYIITFTQIQAGFETQVFENILHCDMDPITYKIADRLKLDLVVENKEGQVILADTSVKLQQKLHQIYSGTCKFEDGTSKIIDLSKALFIKERFKDEKIAIFYKFVEEFNALKEVFRNQLTNDLSEFNASDKNIALQIVSGSEGISLSAAKYLVYYNIDFSSRLYWQSRDRLTSMNRKSNDVYWIFSNGGIEEKIYRTVQSKKDYTLEIFRRDFGSKAPKQNNSPTDKRRMAMHKIDPNK